MGAVSSRGLVLQAYKASPEGKEEIGGTQRDMLKALQKLRSLERTPEEERILDEFEEFRQQHPIDFSSLSHEDQ